MFCLLSAICLLGLRGFVCGLYLNISDIATVYDLIYGFNSLSILMEAAFFRVVRPDRENIYIHLFAEFYGHLMAVLLWLFLTFVYLEWAKYYYIEMATTLIGAFVVYELMKEVQQPSTLEVIAV